MQHASVDVRSGRLLAMSPDGKVVVRPALDGLEIVSLPRGDSIPLRVERIDDFVCVDQLVWVASEGHLQRFDRAGTPVGDPMRLGDEPGVLVGTSEAGRATAIWRTGTRCSLLQQQADGTIHDEVWGEDVHADDFVALLSSRRVLLSRGDTVRIHDVGRGDVSVGRLPVAGRVVGGGPLFDGRSLALFVRTSEYHATVHIFSRGVMMRSCSAGDTRRFALAGQRAVAILLDRDGDLVVRDLRLDKVIGRYTPGIDIADLAVTPDGSHLVIVEDGRPPHATHIVRASELSTAAPAADREPALDAPLADEAEDPAPPVLPVEPTAPPVELDDAADGGGADGPVSTRTPRRPAAAPRSDRAVHEAVQRVLEAAVCHVGLLYERLYFLSRNVGMLPRTSSAEDPFGPIVISDSDVSTILAGLNRLKSVPLADRTTDVGDPFRERLQQSRAALGKAFEDDGASSGLARLVKSFALDDTATDLLLLALSPDWDMRVSRLSGFLNNDATITRPKMGHLVMAAQLGVPSIASEAIESIERSLIATGLLLRDSARDAPVMGQVVRCPDYIVELSTSPIESTLTDASSWDQLRWAAEDKEPLRQSLRRELKRGPSSPRLIVIEGPPGSGRMAMSRAVALDEGIEIEPCELVSAARREVDVLENALAASAFRARVRGGLLLVRSDGVLQQHDRLWGTLWALVVRLELPCFVLVRSGELEGVRGAVRFIRYMPPLLQPEGRKTLWRDGLGARDIRVKDAVLDDISARYDITPGRLLEVVDELDVRQEWDQRRTVGVAQMRQTLRDITVQRLTNLATRYDSKITLNDLIYPESVAGRIRELVHRIRYRHRVLADWSFADKAHQSYGVSALFYGPPGTGKTAGAAAICNALEVDLYMVDFPSIMSKWVGETEQNLAKVFDEAEASSVALLFDEADAIFGKRSAKQDSSSDRYANLTVNYLIQRMESFKGLAILTTNLESAMDEAFERRITARIRFPESDEEQRVRLWKHLLPRGASYDKDVDLTFLARVYRMEGAYIRRALTRAAFRAASSGRDEPVLTQEDLMWAALAEYEDMGRVTFAEGARAGARNNE
jgi:SpoVK/Ycf46/Vps4 family AAA+-type ATPase